MFLPQIKYFDIENMDIVAFQVTSNSDECAEIKKNGLHNLQWILGNDTGLNLCISYDEIKILQEHPVGYSEMMSEKIKKQLNSVR